MRKPRDYRVPGSSLKPTPLTPHERQILEGVPDAVHPSQLENGATESGERRLLEALLVEAIAFELNVTVLAGGRHRHGRPDAHGGVQGRGRAVVREARAWLRGAPSLMPFEFVCQHLGLEPDAVRRAVFAGDRRALAALPLHATGASSWGAPGTSGSG